MKKITNYFLPLLIVSFLTFSCSDDNESDNDNIDCEIIEEINGVKYRETNQNCIASFSGTICTISGQLEASPNETIKLQYNSNIEDPNITWEIESGDIELVENQTPSIASFRINEGFQGAVVIALGSGIQQCSEKIEITLK